MCGIGGILRTDGKRIPAAWLKTIDQRIAHRGPDDSGRFKDRVEFEDDGGAHVVEVALVHRRLSIIDHDGGTQPMVSEQGRDADEGLVAVVFNGCIYNQRELREYLTGRGHTFTSDHSDTEVLVHGYREWGAELAEHLEGMYAFAIWDRDKRSLTLARDWFGEKPLYVRHGVGSAAKVTAFASDARCLAELTKTRLPRAGDPSLELWSDTYLQLGMNVDGMTCYGDRGTAGVVIRPPTMAERVGDLMGARRDEPLTIAETERLLDRAVARRLEADVPLGCFLSGGVDSSLIAHYAQKHLGNLRTFCVRMPDARYDESVHAEAAAQHLGTDHTTLEIAPHPADDLVHLVHLLGQPFGDSSILPTYWVSKAAREHVTVALSGDGGDELFVGYERYKAARHVARHRRVLRWIPRALGNGAHAKSLRSKLARLGDMAREMEFSGVLGMESMFMRDQVTALVDGLPERVANEPLDLDPLQSLRKSDLIRYLPDDLLLKVDTASMAVALEVRAPLLDRDLARAVLAAPTHELMPDGRRKGLLRQVARKHLPKSIVDRPKMGFAIPISQWFRADHGGMRTLLLDHLRANDPFGPLPLERRAVKRIIDEHLSGKRDHGQRLFTLLTLSIWAKSL